MKDCATKYCLGTPIGRNRKCQKCRMRLWRAANPIKAAFATLKTNAKKRGCVVQLTLMEFTQFCIDTNYHLLRGLEGHDLTIDRMDETVRVYRIGNIQVLTRLANLEKYRTRKHVSVVPKDDSVPF